MHIVMTRIWSSRMTGALVMMLAFTANAAIAGPVVGAGPPVIKVPHIILNKPVIVHQQQPSFDGVHINIQLKRDRLQGASDGAKASSQPPN
jgi:hypothetical protein